MVIRRRAPVEGPDKILCEVWGKEENRMITSAIGNKTHKYTAAAGARLLALRKLKKVLGRRCDLVKTVRRDGHDVLVVLYELKYKPMRG